MTAGSDSVRVHVDGRVLSLSNLDKVLYPDVGFTKGEVIDYYTRVATTLLPHLCGRPLTRRRWPDGVAAEPFFEKNAPRGTPDWVRTVSLPTPESTKGHERIAYVLVEEVPTLVWLANLAALELHVPQWRVDADGTALDPDLLVIDLDPGAPAGLLECAEVALLLREVLTAEGLTADVKTSGSKGLQLYVPLRPTPGERTTDYARTLTSRLAQQRPDLVLGDMARSRRRGKVFLDWSQNNPAKTTIAPYSLRGRERPWVSTPLAWEELENLHRVDDLFFDPDTVLGRIEDHGDLFAELTVADPHARHQLPE